VISIPRIAPAFGSNGQTGYFWMKRQNGAQLRMKLQSYM